MTVDAVDGSRHAIYVERKASKKRDRREREKRERKERERRHRASGIASQGGAAPEDAGGERTPLRHTDPAFLE